MSDKSISHALVLPDHNFAEWLAVAKPYAQAFERVAIVRSPTGNDLNRFRNVTAVQAPRTWFKDDALAHIRRAYPTVVQVDVIPAETPDELAPVLKKRIQKNDRYGKNTGSRVYERFILDWPTNARPARIARPFSTKESDKHEGINIYAPQGARVMAAVAGKVVVISTQPTAMGYGQYVQISTQFNELNYLVTYAYLQDISVQVGQTVQVGDLIAASGEAGADSIKIVVQNPPYGERGFILPSVVDPTSMIYWQGLKVKPTSDGLRVRSLPSTDGEILGQVNLWDWLDSLEGHGRTLVKVGTEDEWLRVRMPDGQIGYTAAWFLEARTQDDITQPFPNANLTGMNLDIYNPMGHPAPDALGHLGWVRMKFNVSFNPNNNTYGNTDVQAAYNRYAPVYESYVKGGRKMMVVFTHQLYGEGAGYVWGYHNWDEFIPRYVDFARRAAQLFAGKGIVHVYQIWNEQDTLPENARAAVPVPAEYYAKLLTQTIQAIRSVDSEALIITGGHVTGGGPGSQYAAATIRTMPTNIRPDGIAVHAYGLGPASSSYSIHGRLEPTLELFSNVLPDKPLWITEWGVLDRQQYDETSQVAAYAKGFLDIIKQRYSDRVAAAIWYAWAKGMDNGYGLVSYTGQPLQPLYDEFLKA